MEQYSKKVMEHFANPQNVGEIKDADGVGQVGNIRCGDIMHVFIKVGKRSSKNVISIPSTVILSETKDLPAAISGDSSAEPQNDNKLSTEAWDDRNTEEYIEDVKFKTLGCAAAIASSSMMTELCKGKSVAEAKKISRDDINEALGILPAQKYHCSILSAEGIKKAIEDYESRHK